jgi:hypothetical protein
MQTSRLCHHARSFTPVDLPNRRFVRRFGFHARFQTIHAHFQESGEETKRAEKKVWQNSFWEQFIFTEKFLTEKLNYIHMNPVRAGLADDPVKYPYSSYRNYEFNDNTLIEIDKDW